MEEQKKENLWFIFIIAVLFIGVGAIYLSLNKGEDADEKPITEEVIIPDDLRIQDRPEIRYPVPEQPKDEEEEVVVMMDDTEEPEEAESEPQPQPEPVAETEPEQTITEKPETLPEALEKFLGNKLEELFITTGLVRNFVVTVDNMTGRKLPQRFSFTKRPEGKFAVIKEPNEDKFLDPINYQRYASVIKLFATVDLQQLVSVYVRYYHLFQSAYEELGYPGRYFNDRLVEVIDHLLATPKVTGRIALLQPKVYYQFANPDLEALSAGQKILIRIGPANADVVKLRLTELRQLLTNLET